MATDYTAEIEALEAAISKLLRGEQVVEVEINGQRTKFNAANYKNLESRVAHLKAQKTRSTKKRRGRAMSARY